MSNSDGFTTFFCTNLLLLAAQPSFELWILRPETCSCSMVELADGALSWQNWAKFLWEPSQQWPSLQPFWASDHTGFPRQSLNSPVPCPHFSRQGVHFTVTLVISYRRLILYRRYYKPLSITERGGRSVKGVLLQIQRERHKIRVPMTAERQQHIQGWEECRKSKKSRRHYRRTQENIHCSAEVSKKTGFELNHQVASQGAFFFSDEA